MRGGLSSSPAHHEASTRQDWGEVEVDAEAHALSRNSEQPCLDVVWIL